MDHMAYHQTGGTLFYCFFVLLRTTQQIIDTLWSMGYLFVNSIRKCRERREGFILNGSLSFQPRVK